MPILSESYKYTINNSVAATLINHERTKSNIVSTEMYERKELSDNFFEHIRGLLEQTNIDITFDNENHKMSIFGLDFIIKCCTGPNTSNYYNARPVIIPPRLDNVVYMLRHRDQYRSGGAVATNNESICGNGNQEQAKTIEYGIKIYYNTNYIVCNYISKMGYEVPFFCFIQGTIADTNKKAVYLSECINIATSYAYQRIIIPDNNKYNDNMPFDYLPAVDNIETFSYNGLGNYIFDSGVYPRPDILNRIYDYTQNVILKKLSSYNGLITYDNVFDASLHTDANLYLNLGKIHHHQIYTIDNQQYYCPGTDDPTFTYGYDTVRPLYYIFKL